MAFRSTTGCLACKIKHKKCDETKPHCLRCQKSRRECPGYTYIHDPNKPSRKLRTLLAPRTVGRSRATTLQATPLVNTEDSRTQFAPGTSLVANTGPWPEDINISNRLASSPSIKSHISNRLEINIVNPDRADFVAKPMTSGQASLLAALLSLESTPDAYVPPQCAQPITKSRLPLRARIRVVSDTHIQGDATQEDEDPESTVNVIFRELVLDKTVESNALSFVLQGYTTWLNQMALEPLKLMYIGRDFVYNHFGDGEQSRWIVVLLANIGNKMGNVGLAEGSLGPMLSALQVVVRRRLGVAKSHPNPTIPELAKVLDSALQTIHTQFYVSPVGEAVILRQEAESLFRQLCPGPPDEPINLPSILQNPLSCLGRFAMMDISFSLSIDMPTLSQYEVSIPSQLAGPDGSVSTIRDDGILQWLHGLPNQLILVFAKLISMRADGSTPNKEVTALVEQEIHEIQSYKGSSFEGFLAIMRFVVQECWRQVAFVYLYMAVCGDSSDTPRVKESFKRLMKLLNGSKPGRLPDEFLAVPLVIISPAAQRKRDRQIVMQRVLGLGTFCPNNNIISIVEDYWARADEEERPIMWSDVAVSRRKVLGV